jgi:hypothetical protein
VATGNRGRPIATGPTVGPRLVPNGAPWAAADQARPGELRFVAVELITPAGVSGPAAGGLAEVVFQVPQDRVWQIERIVVSTTSAAVTSASVYVGTADPANLVDFTPAGNGDVADEVHPIVAPAGNALRIRWTGMTAGAVGTVRLQGWAGGLQQVNV